MECIFWNKDILSYLILINYLALVHPDPSIKLQPFPLAPPLFCLALPLTPPLRRWKEKPRLWLCLLWAGYLFEDVLFAEELLSFSVGFRDGDDEWILACVLLGGTEAYALTEELCH